VLEGDTNWMMDQTFFEEVLNSSRHAIICMNLNHEITFANTRAEKVLNISKESLLEKNPIVLTSDFVKKHESELSTNKKVILQNLKLENGNDISAQGYMSGIIGMNKELQGVTIFLKESKSQTNEKRRTYDEIRGLILSSLCEKQKTINQIAKDVEVNWKTVENHLTYLAGKQLITEVFSSEYVRIFSITQRGKARLETLDQDVSAEAYELSREVTR